MFLLVDKSEKTKSHQGERNFRNETAKQEKKINVSWVSNAFQPPLLNQYL